MESRNLDRLRISPRRYLLAFAVTALLALLGSSSACGQRAVAAVDGGFCAIAQADNLPFAQKGLTQADVNLIKARIAYQRSEELHAENLLLNAVISQACYNLDRTQATFNSVEAQVNNAKRAL